MATMAPSNIGYSLREAMHHFKRNFGTTFGAIVTIFLSLFIIGTFVFLSALVDNMVGNVEDKVTIQAYLADDASQDAIDALQTKIEGWDNVESVTYKSKDEALEEYKATMSNKNAEDAVAALDGTNPVPASLVIKLNDPQEVENVANKLIDDSDFASVADGSDPANSVQYGRETVERLFTVTSYIRIIAIVLVVLLHQQHDSPLHLGTPPRDRHRAPRRRLERLHPWALRRRGRHRGTHRRPARNLCAPGRHHERPAASPGAGGVPLVQPAACRHCADLWPAHHRRRGNRPLRLRYRNEALPERLAPGAKHFVGLVWGWHA